MIYADKYNDDGITREDGIFWNMEEFLPYRAAGWSSVPETDAIADAILAEREEEEMDNAALAPEKGESNVPE